MKAIEKLQNEMNTNKGNSYIQVVGAFLVQHIQAHPEDAEKILAEGKTIGKSLEAMRKEAEKKKTANVAILTDQEGFAIVLKYFGIESTTAIINPHRSEPAPVPEPESAPAKPQQQKTQADFAVSLEDFL